MYTDKSHFEGFHKCPFPRESLNISLPNRNKASNVVHINSTNQCQENFKYKKDLGLKSHTPLADCVLQTTYPALW